MKLSQQAKGALNATLDGFVAEKKIAGGSMLVQIHGEEVFYRDCGYADAEAKRAPSRDDLYRIYSMSKPVTITALLQLCERRLLRLSDQLADYFPGFAAMPVLRRGEDGGIVLEEQETPLTLLHLCTMTSGLPYPGDDSPAARIMQRLACDLPNDLSTTARVHEVGKRGALCFQPGESWLYGYSHDVLGAVIELVSGQPFGDYLRESIFDPLGMTDTGFCVPADKRTRFVPLYRLTADGYQRETASGYNEVFLTPPAFESGGGGLVSTVDDYTTFCRMLVQGGVYGNTRILSEASIRDMARDRLNDAQHAACLWWPRGYGYGIGVRTMADPAKRIPNGSVGEFGWDGMAGTWMAIDPALDMTMVFMQQMIISPGMLQEPVGLTLMARLYEVFE